MVVPVLDLSVAPGVDLSRKQPAIVDNQTGRDIWRFHVKMWRRVLARIYLDSQTIDTRNELLNLDEKEFPIAFKQFAGIMKDRL